jgi:DNA polymerase I-like protein with 3'-5' exonuclease and polymerase domains
MLGFSAVVNAYLCCEPSTRTAAGLRRIYEFIKTFRNDFTATINEAPFEDVELPAAQFDFAMTSPPYYDTERYAPGEATNSFNKYPTFTDWCAGFYAPLIHRTMRALKPGACFVLNIGSRIYPLNDQLYAISKDRYLVDKQKGRLSASNGLGKDGEGETFYEVKNPGTYQAPAELPIIVVAPDALTFSSTGAPVLVIEPPLIAEGSETTQERVPAVVIAPVAARVSVDAFLTQLDDAPAQSQPEPLPVVSQIETPATVKADAPDAEKEPDSVAVNALDFALDVVQADPVVFKDAPQIVEAAQAHVTSATPHEIAALMAERGHALYARQGKLVITNSSTLTDDERELLRSNKAKLLVIIPTFQEAETQRPQSLIQFLGEGPAMPSMSDWKPEPPPVLDGITDIELDFETDGLLWHKGARPIGVSVKRPGLPSKYYPWGHQGSKDNLDEATMRRWAQEQLKNKRITNANTRFDVHMSRVWGADFVDQGCTFSDVMHYAALLDDHRKRFALNELAKDFLKREKQGMDLDPTRMASYEPWMVALRAEGDTDTVSELKAAMWPMLDAQDLQRVRKLEDQIIPVVVEMEKNGAPIDVELLTRWDKESEEHHHRLIKQISAECGFNFDDSDAAWIRLFEKFKIPIVTAKKLENNQIIDSGKPTFKDAVLARIDHPTIKLARFAAQLDSLRSKVYTAYPDVIDANGILRFELNQLRIDDERGKRGTVSGRFSAPYVQQVPNEDNHTEVFGDLYYPRELYIAGSGLFFAGDAAQIEYRIFAGHAKNKRVLDAYKEDPRLSFHKLMHPRMIRFKPDFSYSNMKNFNFMRIYGGGSVKTAVMMGHITEEEGWEIQIARAQKTSPKMAQIREIDEIYAREMPEVKPLLQKAMHLAMSKCDRHCNANDDLHKQYRHRGYVKTVLGRRSRFPNDYKIYKALNAIIQGTAADIMKTKLVELYEQRHALGFTMRMTIHDEVCGDVPDVASAERIGALLNQQSVDMVVPILWEIGTGKNWAEAK